MRIFYRLRQFWSAVFISVDARELEQARLLLTPGQWELFTQLQPAEQGHALRMLGKLRAQGENQPDLLLAALLHDVGKLRYRTNPIERALVVLMRAIAPAISRRLGKYPTDGWEGLPGWRKALVLAEQHAEWGAALARQAGVSPRVESLIRHHQRAPGNRIAGEENGLQAKLWSADNDF